MTTKYVFSRNQKVGSRLISWAASFERLTIDAKPSHAAILLADTWIIESTMIGGVRIVPYESWLALNEELYKVDCKVPGEYALKVAARLWGRPYDWKGLAYFAIGYIRLLVTGKLPVANKWERSRHFFCTELVAQLENKDYSMRSPASICNELLLGSSAS
jgi:hypothetical protein